MDLLFADEDNLPELIDMLTTFMVLPTNLYTIITKSQKVYNKNNAETNSSGAVEDLLEPDESEEEQERETPLTAETSSLSSGALSDECNITVTMRDVDSEEEDQVKNYIEHSCGCDLGHKNSSCSALFLAVHYISVCGAFAEMSHNCL